MTIDTVFLTPAQVCERWGVSPSCLYQWRVAGKGPRFSRIGKAVRYNREDILAFEASSAQTGAAS